MTRRLTLLLHGHSGVGKSTLAATAPGPILILDAEAGSEYLEGRQVTWDPSAEAPPEAGEWDFCIVNVLNYETVVRAYEWLATGEHPFRSVILDSVSEIQQRSIDSIAGASQMKRENWGELLRTVAAQLRKFRDLKAHPTNPLWAVIFVCMTTDKDGKFSPLVQGGLKDFLPYYVDVVGWLATEENEFGQQIHNLYIGPSDEYLAKERLGGRLGTLVTEPNVKEMIRVLNNKKEEN
jgi:hypothetical protein